MARAPRRLRLRPRRVVRFRRLRYQAFDNVNSILNAEGSAFRLPYPPDLLLELVLVKIASTALCRQSGLVGGVYAPSLFMGAALGSAYGAALVPLALAGVPRGGASGVRPWEWRVYRREYAGFR